VGYFDVPESEVYIDIDKKCPFIILHHHFIIHVHVRTYGIFDYLI